MVIENSFEGWIAVDKEYAIFSADDFIFHIFSPKPDFGEAKSLLKNFFAQNSVKGEYIQAQATSLHRIAFLNTFGAIDFFDPHQGISFSTPIIIKSCGNTECFNRELTHDWNLRCNNLLGWQYQYNPQSKESNDSDPRTQRKRIQYWCKYNQG